MNRADTSRSRATIIAGLWYGPILMWTLTLLTLPGDGRPADWRLRVVEAGTWPVLGLILAGFGALTVMSVRRIPDPRRPPALRSLAIVLATFVLLFHFVATVLFAGFSVGSPDVAPVLARVGDGALWGGLALATTSFAAAGIRAVAQARDPATTRRWAAVVAGVLSLVGAALPLTVFWTAAALAFLR